MIWKQLKVPHQLSGGYSTGLSIGCQYSNYFCDIFTRKLYFYGGLAFKLAILKEALPSGCQVSFKFSFFFFFFCYNIVLAPFKLALKVSKLTISFVSSLELVRQVQPFYKKGKSPQEQQQSLKIQKKTICKTRMQTYRALPRWFWGTFPQKNVKYVNQSQIDTLKAYSIQGPLFSIRMVIGIFCSDTVFVQLNQYSQLLRRQCKFGPKLAFLAKYRFLAQICTI